MVTTTKLSLIIFSIFFGSPGATRHSQCSIASDVNGSMCMESQHGGDSRLVGGACSYVCTHKIVNNWSVVDRMSVCWDGLLQMNVNEVDLYSALIVVAHTQGAQVRITQFYLQITPYLPLPRKRSPDGASQDWGCGQLQPTSHLSTPKGWKVQTRHMYTVYVWHDIISSHQFAAWLQTDL